MSKVKLHQTHGKVYIKSNGKKEKVEALIPESVDSMENMAKLYGENTVPIKDKDIIITGENSYAINLQDENDPDYTDISLFPNSKGQVSVKGKEITEVKIINGLFRVETNNPIVLPLAEINYLNDSTNIFYIEVQDEMISISLVTGHVEVTHQKLGEKVKIQMKEQVTLTPSKIKGPLPVEQKFKNAYKKQREFESKFYNLYDDASFSQQKLYISDMEKQISQFKSDIRELEKEGGSAPAQMKIGLQRLEKQLKGAKEDFREERKRRSNKEKKQKELSELEKKFQARERKFQNDLDKLTKELSNEDRSTQMENQETKLEKKIESAREELNSSQPSDEESEEDLTELQKRIQAAGDELNSPTSTQSSDAENEEDLTELEKKIQAAGEELNSNQHKNQVDEEK